MASKSIKITTTSLSPMCLFYRIGDKDNSRVIEVPLPARALMHEVVFANDTMYNAFIEQNQRFIDSQKIIIGDAVKANKVEQINEKKSAEEHKAAAKTTENAVKAVENAINAKSKNAKMKISVEKN